LLSAAEAFDSPPAEKASAAAIHISVATVPNFALIY
jgi:hypothetical protein